MSLKRILKRWGVPQENIKQMSMEIEAGYGTSRYLQGVTAGNQLANSRDERYQATLPPGTVLAVRRMPDGTVRVFCPNPAAALQALRDDASASRGKQDAERFDEIRPSVARLLSDNSKRN